MARQCKHEWVFVPAVIVPIGSQFPSSVETSNAECVKCGARTWAHGRSHV